MSSWCENPARRWCSADLPGNGGLRGPTHSPPAPSPTMMGRGPPKGFPEAPRRFSDGPGPFHSCGRMRAGQDCRTCHLLNATWPRCPDPVRHDHRLPGGLELRIGPVWPQQGRTERQTPDPGGLFCTREGIPVPVQVFEGNTGEPPTLQDQIRKVKEKVWNREPEGVSSPTVCLYFSMPSTRLIAQVDAWTVQAMAASRWLARYDRPLGDNHQAATAAQAGAQALGRLNRLNIQGQVAPLAVQSGTLLAPRSRPPNPSGDSWGRVAEGRRHYLMNLSTLALVMRVWGT